MVALGEKKGTEWRYIKGIEFIASIFLVHLKPVGGMTAPISHDIGLFSLSPFFSAFYISHT